MPDHRERKRFTPPWERASSVLVIWVSAVATGAMFWWVAEHQSVGSFAFVVGLVVTLIAGYTQSALLALWHYKQDKSRRELEGDDDEL